MSKRSSTSVESFGTTTTTTWSTDDRQSYSETIGEATTHTTSDRWVVEDSEMEVREIEEGGNNETTS